MSPSITLMLVIAVLGGAGTYLMLERSLIRVMLGVILFSNGINVLLLSAGGPAGGAPLVGVTAPEDMSDPLPQAMILTAIVITLGVTAFLLGMAYRAWQLTGTDDVQDDVEDARVAARRPEEDDEGVDDLEGREEQL